MENYPLKGVSYEVELFFSPKFGLSRVTMTADDDYFRETLEELIRRFGKPGLESEYDGAHETTSTRWIWATAHGKLTLAADGADGREISVDIHHQIRSVGRKYIDAAACARRHWFDRASAYSSGEISGRGGYDAWEMSSVGGFISYPARQ